ncbi:unnamed protein product [Linum tenue]|uniref:Uncharacterized protein n=1 Tax=Linum tenue TaxID=586396 RepID=A0AAV0HVJ3_9ROSI|nr:unnamed protein product [Linum tenue]
MKISIGGILFLSTAVRHNRHENRLSSRRPPMTMMMKTDATLTWGASTQAVECLLSWCC